MTDYRKAESEFRPLGFNTRTIRALAGRGICSLRDLATLTERDLSSIPGIGLHAMAQLRVYIRKTGPTIEIHTRGRVVSVNFDAKALTAIDAWAVDNDVKRSRAEAIRRLVEQALGAPPHTSRPKK
jgi:hypothetical protein